MALSTEKAVYYYSIQSVPNIWPRKSNFESHKKSSTQRASVAQILDLLRKDLSSRLALGQLMRKKLWALRIFCKMRVVAYAWGLESTRAICPDILSLTMWSLTKACCARVGLDSEERLRLQRHMTHRHCLLLSLGTKRNVWAPRRDWVSLVGHTARVFPIPWSMALLGSIEREHLVSPGPWPMYTLKS